MRLLLNINILVLFGTLVACKNSHEGIGYSDKALNEKVLLNLDYKKKNPNLIEKELVKVYELNANNLLWFDQDKPKHALVNYFSNFYGLQDEGIDVSKLKLVEIKNIQSKVEALYKGEISLPIDSIINWDFLLTQSYLEAGYMLSYGSEYTKVLKESKYEKNATNIANNLVYAINNSEVFPSFDIYRPQNDIYAALVLAIKSWMLLGKDIDYNLCKEAIINGTSTTDQLRMVMQKELGVDSIIDYIQLVKQYQYQRGLEEVGKVNGETMEFLKMKPEAYRKKIKINLERLRHLPSQQSVYITLNVRNGKLIFWIDGQIRYSDLAQDYTSELFRARLVDNLKEHLLVEEEQYNNNFAKIASEGSLNIYHKINDQVVLKEHIGVRHKSNLVAMYDSLRLDQFIANSFKQDNQGQSPYFIKLYLTAVMDPFTKKVQYYSDKYGWDAEIRVF